MMVSAQRYRLLASLVSLALALLYLLVATENARADDLNPAADSALNSALQAAAAAVDEPVPAPTSQQASTEQAANVAAEATQQQPRNLVISIRINSPGDDGPISQSNVAGSVAGASNDSSTGQGGAPGAQQASEQQAATDQTATAAATATQAQPQNIVILIRINSPGDNGPIEQTNTAAAASNAGNVSATRQGEPGNGGAVGTATGAGPDTRAAIGPPAQQDATPAAALPRMSVALLAPAAPRGAIATGHRIDRPAPAARTNHRPARDSANSAPSSTQAASTGPSDRLVVVKSEAREPLTQMKPARRSVAVRGDGAASRDLAVGQRAVDLLGKFAPPTPLQASGSEKDVTNAVVLSLIAVLGAFAVFFGSTYLSSGLRLPDPRSWRHGRAAALVSRLDESPVTIGRCGPKPARSSRLSRCSAISPGLPAAACPGLLACAPSQERSCAAALRGRVRLEQQDQVASTCRQRSRLPSRRSTRWFLSRRPVKSRA